MPLLCLAPLFPLLLILVASGNQRPGFSSGEGGGMPNSSGVYYLGSRVLPTQWFGTHTNEPCGTQVNYSWAACKSWAVIHTDIIYII